MWKTIFLPHIGYSYQRPDGVVVLLNGPSENPRTRYAVLLSNKHKYPTDLKGIPYREEDTIKDILGVVDVLYPEPYSVTRWGLLTTT